jgi:hypothetical protein
MRNKILDLRKAHKKVSAWIARQEQWQRLVNKGHWIGEQPARCGSWNLQCLQEMQEENYNTDFDMCSVGLTCPETEFLMRKRTKLNHTSSILHEFFEEFRFVQKITSISQLKVILVISTNEENGEPFQEAFLLDGTHHNSVLM